MCIFSDNKRSVNLVHFKLKIISLFLVRKLLYRQGACSEFQFIYLKDVNYMTQMFCQVKEFFLKKFICIKVR